MASTRGRCPMTGINRGFSDSRRSFHHVQLQADEIKRQNLLMNPTWLSDDFDTNISSTPVNAAKTSVAVEPEEFGPNPPVKKEEPKKQECSPAGNKKLYGERAACKQAFVLPDSVTSAWGFRKSGPQPSRIHEDRIANFIKTDMLKEVTESENVLNDVKLAGFDCYEDLAQNQVYECSSSTSSTRAQSSKYSVVNLAIDSPFSLTSANVHDSAYVRRPFGVGCGPSIVPVEELRPEYREDALRRRNHEFFFKVSSMIPKQVFAPFSVRPPQQPDEPVQAFVRSSDSGFVGSESTNGRGASSRRSRPFESEGRDGDEDDSSLFSGWNSKICECLDGTAYKSSIYNDIDFTDADFSATEIKHSIEVTLKNVFEPKRDVTVSDTECEDLLKTMSNIEISVKQFPNVDETPELKMKVVANFGGTSKLTRTEVNNNGKLAPRSVLKKEDLRNLARISQNFTDIFAAMNELLQRLFQR